MVHLRNKHARAIALFLRFDNGGYRPGRRLKDALGNFGGLCLLLQAFLVPLEHVQFDEQEGDELSDMQQSGDLQTFIRQWSGFNQELRPGK